MCQLSFSNVPDNVKIPYYEEEYDYDSNGEGKCCLTLRRMRKILKYITDIDCCRHHPTYIPKECINLERITTNNTNTFLYIPDTLVKLNYLYLYGVEDTEIPDTLVNLKFLHLSHFTRKQITIPKTLINLEELTIYDEEINEIPNELINLKKLTIRSKYINKIPDTLIKLEELYVKEKLIKEIPKTLINLRKLEFINNKEDEKIINRNRKIKNTLVKFIKWCKNYIILKKLWKIADYYTSKKYHPNNILQYVNLD